MASIKSFAASVVKYGLMCLKLARLYLMVLATFLTCFLKVKFESKIIPRYLKSDTTMSFSPSLKTSACCTIEDLLEKNIQTVLLMLRCRSDVLSFRSVERWAVFDSSTRGQCVLRLSLSCCLTLSVCVSMNIVSGRSTAPRPVCRPAPPEHLWAPRPNVTRSSGFWRLTRLWKYNRHWLVQWRE